MVVKNVFGRGVTGELQADAVGRMRTELVGAEVSPLVRKFAVWLVDGLSAEGCLEQARQGGSKMSMPTALWYRSRAMGVLKRLFAGRAMEFGLEAIVRKVDGDQTISQLAVLMGVSPSTLREKIPKAERLGLPPVMRVMGRTLKKKQYLFSEDAAQAWLDAYFVGDL